MPPAFVKTIESLIYWEYAKIIARVAMGKKSYGFITDRWKKLKSGELCMSGCDRDLLFQIRYSTQECEYCGSTDNLQWDHIVPRSLGGPDTAANQVLCCRSCNSSKSNRDLYHWFGIEAKEKIPLLVKSKYLKLMYDIHKNAGTLQKADLNGDGKLTVLDLAHVLKTPEDENQSG